MNKKNKSISELANVISKLPKKDRDMISSGLKNIGVSASNMKSLLNEIFERRMAFNTKIIKNNFSAIDELYKDEVQRLMFITRDKELLKKINGLKIFVHGDTGTGKTTLINHMIKRFKGYELHKFIAEELISSKMGQTQLNIIKLQQDLNTNKKNILFIDEVDSIIGNRYKKNELTEYNRITSSFIKLLDSLSDKTIVIFSTNLNEKIDPAIQRRMNFKIEAKKLKFNEIYKMIQHEIKADLTTYQQNYLIDSFKNSEFTISELNSFVNEYTIEDSFTKNINNFEFYISFFKNKKNSIFNAKTMKIKSMLTKIGVEINNEIQN